MANDKLQANEIIDSKNDGGIFNSDIMKALEDINYDISQVDIDSATADDIDGDTYKELERDVEAYEADKMEKFISAEGLAIDDPVRMYLKDTSLIPASSIA